MGGTLSQQVLDREVVGVQPAAEPGDRDTQAVGHRWIERTPVVGRGHVDGGRLRCILSSRCRMPCLALPVRAARAGQPAGDSRKYR